MGTAYPPEVLIVRDLPIVPGPMHWEYRKNPRTAAYIYVMRCGEFLKIGMAADPRRRLESFQIGNPLPVEIAHKRLVSRWYAKHIESACHRALAAHAHRNEWFRCDLALAKAVIRHAAFWGQQKERADCAAKGF